MKDWANFPKAGFSNTFWEFQGHVGKNKVKHFFSLKISCQKILELVFHSVEYFEGQRRNGLITISGQYAHFIHPETWKH